MTTSDSLPPNPFSPTAEFWLDDGVLIAVDTGGIFGFNTDTGKAFLFKSAKVSWPEAADTRGPLSWDEFLAASREFVSKPYNHQTIRIIS